MQYLGGKSKIRKEISEFLESVRNGRDYLEPFVGGAWVLQEMTGTRSASDNNAALITMYQYLQKGWMPPENVSEELYAQYKQKQDPADPLTAFIGIGCSFGGKWFGGYARQTGYNFASGGKRALQKQLPLIMNVTFSHKDYREIDPKNKLIYCDPPYANTTGYKDKFDSSVFWETMRLWSKDNTVVISEYCAPDDFICVKQIPTKTIIRNTNNVPIATTEKLFVYDNTF
jgi:DNA adenine methylase